jgi:aspartate aminotransferase
MATVAGLRLGRSVAVSATLAANEVIAGRRCRGLPVLPLGFGEAGLPVHPVLREALAVAGGANGYGPVAGDPALRQAAAGYWARRGLPASPGQVVCGPGSKPLLFALLLVIGGGVALPRPSWVSYAAQAAMIGIRPHFVPSPAGEGGIPDPAALAAAARAAARAGRPIRPVLVTLPDNPTGRLASPATVAALCEVAAAWDLVIVCDEIYRDLVHDPAAAMLSPAQAAPDQTVITTGLSKSLALGGWRIGVARMPPGPAGRRLGTALLGAGSEIWSAPAAPVQHAAALAFAEPPPIRARIAASRALHGTVARAAAAVCADAGLAVAAPQGGFYVYPDFEPWREHLARRHQVTTAAALAALLLERYGAVTLPGSAFGEPPAALRLRLATALLYGDTPQQQETALTTPHPARLPWITTALARLREILTDLANPASAGAGSRGTRAEPADPAARRTDQPATRPKNRQAHDLN